jgi:hypothetical protein
MTTGIGFLIAIMMIILTVFIIKVINDGDDDMWS